MTTVQSGKSDLPQFAYNRLIGHTDPANIPNQYLSSPFKTASVSFKNSFPVPGHSFSITDEEPHPRKHYYIPDEFYAFINPYEKVIPPAGVFRPYGIIFYKRPGPDYSYNRAERIRIFYRLAARFEKENPAVNGIQMIWRLCNLMKGIENIAHRKALYYTQPPQKSLHKHNRGQFLPDPVFMLFRDTRQHRYRLKNSMLTPFFPDGAPYPEVQHSDPALHPNLQWISIFPSTCEYTFINNLGAVQIRRVLEDPGRERAFPYNNPRPDIQEGCIIFDLAKSGRNVFGEPYTHSASDAGSGVYIHPDWKITLS